MTLRSRLIFGSALMGLCLLIVAVTTVCTLVGMSRSMEQVEEEYEERAELAEVREQIQIAHAILATQSPDVEVLRDILSQADDWLAEFIKEQSGQEAGGEAHQATESAAAERTRVAIRGVLVRLDEPAGLDPEQLEDVRDELQRVSSSMRLIVGEADEQVRQAGGSAERELRYGLLLFSSSTLVALLIGIMGAVYTYRSVMSPIRELRDQIRKASYTAKGHTPPTGPVDELSAIRSDFVDVVGELNDLYRTLEDRVNNKSRELVRAERLASVGYLAAGIAHEINNPLNAISGYSEIVRRDLRKAGDTERWEESVDSLAIVQREALRCKEITDRLLSLSRKSPDARTRVDLGMTVRQTIDLINGLPHLSGRTIRSHLPVGIDAGLCVMGVPSEFVQVFLNLMVNAVEACEPGCGEVEVTGRRVNDRVIVVIKDNGAGMTTETLERLFEPFYTQKRGQQAAGTGLGMSIVHAIIVEYGGTVQATSDGPAQGTVVTINLPAFQHEVTDE